MAKKYNKVPLDEFLAANGFKSRSKLVKKRNWFIQTIIAFIALVFVSGLIGAIMTIPLFISATAVIPVADAGLQTWREIPSEIEEIQIAEINTLYDINGKVFAEVWSENRIELESLDQINDFAINALISTEDKRFYEHEGFDIIGTLRAALTRSGGGSGITQQTIKNLRFYNQAGIEDKNDAIDNTLNRKLVELKMALAYEDKFTKDEILLTYFNTVAVGGSNIYGIEAASNYFFDKPASELTLAEASALVGTLQNPVYYDMRFEDNYDNWRARQYDVLTRMETEGVITTAEKEEAYNTELNLVMKEK